MGAPDPDPDRPTRCQSAEAQAGRCELDDPHDDRPHLAWSDGTLTYWTDDEVHRMAVDAADRYIVLATWAPTTPAGTAHGRGTLGGPLAGDPRAEAALGHLDLSGRGLEIGPSYSPLVPKVDGVRVETVDHAGRDELVHKYTELGVEQDKLDLIAPVDYVWNGGSLVDAIGQRGAYDYIVAAHVLEHCADLVGFLNDCAELLTPTGRLALVVPDKRASFDRFKPLTSVGDAIDGHLRPLRFHPPGALLDQVAYDVMLDDHNAWWIGQEGTLKTAFANLDPGRTVIQRGVDQQQYYDVHRWIFTPASFALLIDDLAEIGYQPFRVVGTAPARGFEFYVTLGKGAWPTDTRPRIERLLDIERELGEIQNEAYAQRVHSLEAALARAEAEIAELRTSTSWRFTAPLRSVSSIVHGRRAAG